MPRTISDLVRTMQNYFRIGVIRIKDNSGVVELKNGADNAFAQVGASGLKLKGSSSGETILQAAAAAAATYTLPAADGSSGQVLATNASGGLLWATVAIASGELKSHSEAIVFGTGSGPIAIVTPPANAFIVKVIVDVDEAFDATAPSLSVGVAGTTSRYMGATDIDLTTIGVYEVEPLYQEDGTPEEIIATWVVGTGSPSTGSLHVTVQYANPVDD